MTTLPKYLGSTRLEGKEIEDAQKQDGHNRPARLEPAVITDVEDDDDDGTLKKRMLQFLRLSLSYILSLLLPRVSMTDVHTLHP